MTASKQSASARRGRGFPICYCTLWNEINVILHCLTIIWASSLSKHAIKTKKIVSFCVIQSDLGEASFKALKAKSRLLRLFVISDPPPAVHSLPLWFLLPWQNLSGVGLGMWSAATAATMTPSKHLKSSHLRGELPSNSERNQRPFHSVSIYKYVTLSAVRGSYMLSQTNRTENTANQGMLEECIFGNHL